MPNQAPKVVLGRYALEGRLVPHVDGVTAFSGANSQNLRRSLMVLNSYVESLLMWALFMQSLIQRLMQVLRVNNARR